MTWGIFKSDSISDSYTKLKTEGWDDMLKSVKDKNATQPNGGSGKKQGTRYGGGKQKDDEAQERKDKKNEETSVEHDELNESTVDHHDRMAADHKEHEISHTKEDENRRTSGDHFHAADHHEQASAAHAHASAMLKKHGASSDHYKEAAKHAKAATDQAKQTSSTLKFRHVSKPKAIKESTIADDSAVLDEEKQAEIVKMGAKEIKHANMKDKQDDAEIMEPHSEGEANFIDQHYVNVTDDPTATKQDGGASKLGKATAPKGQGPAAYKGDSKLSDKDKASYKEGTSEEGSNTISEEKSSGKKSFSSFKAKVTG